MTALPEKPLGPSRPSLSPGEVASVCAHYEIGDVRGVLDFARGSSRSPKALIVASTGRYLLKRRARGRDDPFRVAIGQELQIHLRSRGFPAPRLIGTRGSNNSMVQLNGRVYELFEFIEGEGFDRTPAPCEHAGALLARMHGLLADYRPTWVAPTHSYHNDAATRAHLKAIEGRGLSAAGPRSLYRLAAGEAERRMDAAEPRQLLHGDWHPGNMIFRGGAVAAVLDFDTARVGPRITEVANGAMQFALTRVGIDADAWPDELDVARYGAFIRGYGAEAGGGVAVGPLPYLMAEALIAEVALPIAQTGAFGGNEAGPFLRMVSRKASWIIENAPVLSGLADRALGDGRRREH